MEELLVVGKHAATDEVALDEADEACVLTVTAGI